MKTKQTIPNRLATLAAAVAAAVLLTALTPQSAFGWDTVARDTGYQSAQNPSLFLGDHFDLGWDIGAGYNQAQYGLGTVNAAASLSWNSVTYQTGGGACSGEKYKNTIQVTSVGTWYYSLWVGYTSGQGGLGGGNGQYYNGSSSCNTGGSNGAGNGAFTSDTITVAALNTPTSQSANSASSTSINLTWAQGVSGGSTKNTVIFRSTNSTAPTLTQGAAYTANQTISSGSTNYTCVYATASGTSATDTGLTAGTTYYYYFFAENYSYYSAAVSASAVPRPTTVTWNGSGGDNNLQTDANWVGGVAPVSGISTFLTFAGSTRPNPYNNFPAGSTFSNVFFNGITVPFTLGGSNFNVQQKIENDNSSLVTITNSITWAASSGPTSGEINAVGGNLDFTNGTLTVNGSSIAGIKMWNAAGETNIFDGTVSASGKWFGLTQNPAGAATINGSFTSGDFYVMNGGTLNLASSGSFSTTGLRLGGDYGNTSNQDQTKGGTFSLTSPTGGQTYAGIINSVAGNTSGKLVIYSANTSGTNIINGASYLDSGLIVSNAAGGTLLANASTAFDVKGQQLTFTPYGTILVQGILTSSTSSSSVAGGTLLMNGPGTLLLSNTANAYSGTSGADLNVNSTLITGGGTLGIYGDGSLGVAPNGPYNNLQFTGSGTLQDSSGSISLSANRNISVAASSTATFDSMANTFTIPGIISGSGAVAKVGSGTLTLSGVNTYSGGTTNTAGILKFSNASAFGTGAVTLNGGSLQAGGGYTVTNNFSVAAASVLDMAANNTTLNGNLSGAAALTLNNSGGASTLTLSGNNGSYGGTNTISSGNAVSFGSANAGSASAAWVFNDNTADRVRINIGNGTINFGSISGSGQMQNDTSGTASTLSVGALNASTTFSGTIKDNGTGTLALTKTGTGTQTLSGANSYSGTTTVSGGELAINTGWNYNGNISVASGATLSSTAGNTFGNPPTGTWTIAGTLKANSTSTTIFVLPANVTLNNGALTSLATDTSAWGAMDVNATSTIITANGSTNTISAVNIGLEKALTFNTPLSTDALAVSSILGTSSANGQGVTKNGLGTVTLSGANTYTGATLVSGGTLQMNSANATSASITVTNGATLALNIADALGFTAAKNVPTIYSGSFISNITSAARVTLWNGLTMTGGTLGGISTGDANGAYSLSGTVTATSDAGGNAATMGGSGAISLQNQNVASGTITFAVARGSATPASDLTVSASLIPNSAGLGNGITKTGAGIMTLSGTTNTYTGATTVSAGTLNISGSITAGTNTFTVGNAAGNAVVNFSGGGLTNNNYNIGTVNGAVGAFYQTAGTVRANQAANGANFQIGNAAGAYGYYNAGSGSTLSANEIGVGGEAAAGNAIMDIKGGTVNDGGWLVLARVGGAQTGILNVFSGLLTYAGGGVANCWGAAGSTGIVNILGGSVTNTLSTVGFNLNQSGAANTAILNLNGGTAQGSSVGGTSARVNFNGGTLQASTATNAFMTGLGSATIYGGGGTINNNSYAITIAQPLLAPAGSGVAGIASFTGGAGYIAPPIVTVVPGTGDTTGVGATAIAQINPTTGAVTNVLITCPGVNYTATPAVS